MNTKTLFKLGTMLAILLVLVVGNAFAAKYYVNVSTGLDGYNGLSPTVGGIGVGPKATITNAITAASAGDTIIVDYGFGGLYNETVIPNKKLVFGVSSNSGTGTPVLYAMNINNAIASPNNTVTFTGPFLVQQGLTLTAGVVLGANNLTVAVSVTRVIAAATVDAQLNYTGTINFVYNATMTTGPEMIPASNTTSGGSLSVTAGTLTLGNSITLNSQFATFLGMDLGGNTLTVVGASANTMGADIINGTVAITMSGASSITGAFKLPTLTATTGSTAYTLTLTGVTQVGNITASSKASVAVAAATTVGNVTNNGSGAVTLTAATATGNVTNTSSGSIVLNATGATTVTGNVAQSGSGSILFNSTTSNNITGNVTNNPSLALTNATVAVGNNIGVVRFAGVAVPQTISGNLTVSTAITGATGSAPTNWTNAGEVSFAQTTALVTISGTVLINPTHSITYGGTGAPVVSNNAGVTFANTTGNIVLGGITNSTVWASVTTVTMANNGDFNSAARTTGTLSAGVVLSNSSASNGVHGNIITGAAATTTGGNSATTVTATGSTGGQIYFGGNASTFTTTGNVTNSRTSSSLVAIRVGTAATTANAVSIGGDLINNGAAKIAFDGFNGGAAESFSITGQLNVSAGTVSVANGALTGTGRFTFGTINVTGGTVNLAGAGAGTMNVVTGNATFTSGAFSMTTSVGRTLQLGGLSNKFSGAATRTDFGTAAGDKLVTLLVEPTSVTALQTITGDATTTVWPGPITVNNTSGLQPTVKFTGGNFRSLGATVTFQAGQVEVNGMYIFIGGQLAPFIGNGNFVNTAGYITTAVGANNGFVSLNGTIAGQAVSGAGQFGNFEADNSSGAGAVTIAGATGPFTGTFNLTNGQVVQLVANCLNFNNSTNPPTIVVNNGTLAAAPSFTSMVNVYYIGIDKSTGNELPLAATKLNNLTVATTNGGITAGRGVVNIAVATTVNGTLNIFPGQALFLNGVSLTMNGPAITLDGDLTNNATTSLLILNAATGTTITGAGVLPDIQVNSGSAGNAINGAIGLATGLLGADALRSPLVDDINPGATGSITYAGGAASSLTVAFGTANTSTGSHLLNVTTAAGGTFALGANLTENAAGNLTNATSGSVGVGAFTYSHRGTAPALSGGGTVTGTTGKLQFNMTAATPFTLTSAPVTIAANVEFTTDASTGPWTATIADNMVVGGSLTLSKKAVVDLSVAGKSLTVTGPALTMATATSITATGGTSVLNLNATTPPLVFTYTGSPTIVNLTISNDVVLAGSGAVALSVTGAFAHVAGDLNFGVINLTSSGTYTRTAGTYSATTGYFIFSGTAFNQGATAYSIPNVRLSCGSVTAGGTGVVTVSNALDMNTTGAFTHAGTLAVADLATVNYTQGSFDVAPTYAGSISLVALSMASGGVIHATVWPSSPATLVTTFTVNSAASGNSVQIPGNRQVNTVLNLRQGILDLGTAAARTLTMANNSTVYRRNTAASVLNGGAFSYGTGMTVVYQANAGIGTTGPELPATITNLTFTRWSNAGGGNWTTWIGRNVTVTGLLSIRNDVSDLGFTVNAAGNVEILNESGTYADASDPSVALSNLTFSGTGNQTFAIPASGANVATMRLNQTGTGSTVTISGGALTVTGTMSFVNGILVSGAVPVILAGAVDRTGLTGVSHVYGKVTRTAAALGRYEYPVGSMTRYRPAALTFPTVVPPAVGISVQHLDADPLGVLGLPVADPATTIKIGGYPPYYWLVASTTSLGQSIPYDMELVGTNPFGRPLDVATDLRIIHRFDGSVTVNPWYLEGTGVNYLNFLSLVGADTNVTVRVRGSFGGIVPEASRYTIGIPTRPPVWTVAPPTATVNEGAALSVQFTADPQDVGETITYAVVSGPVGVAISAAGLLTWTPGYDQAGVKSVVVSAFDGELRTGTRPSPVLHTIAITVVNVNRAPVFAPKTASFIGTTAKNDKDTLKVTLAATDADADALTYSFGTIAPAATNAPTVAGTQLTWKPTFADAGKTFTITAVVSDGIATGVGPTPGRDTMTVTVEVKRSRALGDADGNGLVQAADASVVLQYVAGLITVTDPAQLWAMDASKNGTITAYDASLILQHVAGLLIPPLSGSIADGGLGKGAIMQATGTLEMASPEATINPEVVKVGITLSNPANVYSVQLTSKADFSLVSIDAVNASLPEGWDMKWNVVGSELRIVAAGTTPLSSGDLGSIMVRLKDKESRLSFSTDALLNENFQSLGTVEVAAIPAVFALDQNYPNPFNPSTTIRYQIPTDASVNLIIYNVQGQKIRTLISKEQKAGFYSAVWDGRNEAGQTVSTGLYLYRVQAGSFVATNKMLMLK